MAKIGEIAWFFWQILYQEHDLKNHDLRARGQWTKNTYKDLANTQAAKHIFKHFKIENEIFQLLDPSV
jgi:hypothetical protein